jgi:hypothetical protein
MKPIDALRRRLANLLPGQQEEINQTRQAAKLLEIAVDALEFRSDTLFSTGSGLGKKVGREYSRQAAVTRAKAERKREIDQKLVDLLEEAYSTWQEREIVAKHKWPKQEARRRAWEQARQFFEKTTGRSITLRGLKNRLQPLLKGAELLEKHRS